MLPDSHALPRAQLIQQPFLPFLHRPEASDPNCVKQQQQATADHLLLPLGSLSRPRAALPNLSCFQVSDPLPAAGPADTKGTRATLMVMATPERQLQLTKLFEGSSSSSSQFQCSLTKALCSFSQALALKTKHTITQGSACRLGTASSTCQAIVAHNLRHGNKM
jgi:hypothetical protein